MTIPPERVDTMTYGREGSRNILQLVIPGSTLRRGRYHLQGTGRGVCLYGFGGRVGRYLWP
jgi:hypothetical protein